MKLVLLILCTLFGFRVVASSSAMQDLQELQSLYTSKAKSVLNFRQKSFLPDFEEPMLAVGQAVVNRSEKAFSWNILKPSKFSFSIKEDQVYMQMEGGTKQAFSLEKLPEKFKFIHVFFEVLGFKKISTKSWKVKKTAPYTYKLKALSSDMPISNLQVRFFKTGAPRNVSFLNAAKTKFEIDFDEAVKVKK